MLLVRVAASAHLVHAWTSAWMTGRGRKTGFGAGVAGGAATGAGAAAAAGAGAEADAGADADADAGAGADADADAGADADGEAAADGFALAPRGMPIAPVSSCHSRYARSDDATLASSSRGSGSLPAMGPNV